MQTGRLDLELLELNDEASRRLERMRRVAGVDSRVEVIRRALAIYDCLLKYHAHGADLIVRKGNRERCIPLSPDQWRKRRKHESR